MCVYDVDPRKGELLKIEWPQVDFETGVIRLTAGQIKREKPRSLPIYGDMERWFRFQQKGAQTSALYLFLLHFRGAIGP